MDLADAQRMLVSARISGQREHRGEIVAKAEWPAIITPAETQRLRAKLNDPDRRTNRSARRYLLPALLRCDHCGGTARLPPACDGAAATSARSGPGFGGCGKIDDHGRARSSSSWSRPSCTGSTRPDLPAALNGCSRRPRRRGVAGRGRARPGAAGRAGRQLWGKREITRSEWVTARGPIEKRLDAARKTPRGDQPHDRACPAPRRRAGAARAVGDDDADPPEQIVAALLSRRRRARAARLQPLRPVSPAARLARLALPARRHAPKDRTATFAGSPCARALSSAQRALAHADHPAQAHQ